MKRFELVKREDHYGLYNEDGHKIAATLDGCNSKLSKQNCDEIFGVFDVDKLAEEWCMQPENNWSNNNNEVGDNYGSYKEGFNKAMELNKDKLFTVDDMQKLMYATIDSLEQDEGVPLKFFKEFIQSLQQPTEIEVEIEQELIQSSIQGEAIWELKLDENDCLILKRI
jgi:hypothetical protein